MLEDVVLELEGGEICQDLVRLSLLDRHDVDQHRLFTSSTDVLVEVFFVPLRLRIEQQLTNHVVHCHSFVLQQSFDCTYSSHSYNS